jgi:hypothetical protein
MDKENQEEKITTTNLDPVAGDGDEGRIVDISETHSVSIFRAAGL